MLLVLQRTSHLGIPPPVGRPHLVKDPLLAIFIREHLFWNKRHEFLEGQIPYKLLYALHWISPPQLQLLDKWLTIISDEVAFGSQDFACPTWTSGQRIDFL